MKFSNCIFVQLGFAVLLTSFALADPNSPLRQDSVKQFSPAPNADRLRDRSGVPWTSLSFDDSAWKLGNLRQKNPVGPSTTALYRLHFTISESPSTKNYKVQVDAEGDDGLTIWLDGFELKRWGSSKDSKPAMRAIVDITDKVDVGAHVLSIQLDNGVGPSMISCSLKVVSSDSPDTLKGGAFLRDFSGDDENKRQAAINLARKAYAENPKDKVFGQYCMMTYSSLDPPDSKGAYELAKRLLTDKNDIWPNYILDPLIDYGEYEEALRCVETLPWPKSQGRKESYTASILIAKNDTKAAIAKIKVGLSEAQMAPGPWLDQLLDCGDLSSAIPRIREYADTAEKGSNEADKWMAARNLVRIGDYSRSKKLYTQILQVNRPHALDPLADIEAKIGNFESAEQLYREALATRQVTATRGRSAHVRITAKLALLLHRMGKDEQIKDLISKSDLSVSPNQPDFTLNAIRLVFYRRLLIASVYGDQAAYAKEAKRLYDAVQLRRSKCQCNDLDSDLLVALAEGLNATDQKQDAKTVCGIINQSIPKVSLPENQVALAIAAMLLENPAEAKARINEAQLLAPDDVKIKATAQRIQSLK